MSSEFKKLLKKDFLMNDEAKIKYLDGEFRIIKNGSYVICAVSGAKILLNELRYWNVDRQEAYGSAALSLKRERVLKK